MPLQSQEQETLNIKLIHFTKQNSSDEPVQVAFSVINGCSTSRFPDAV